MMEPTLKHLSYDQKFKTTTKGIITTNFKHKKNNCITKQRGNQSIVTYSQNNHKTPSLIQQHANHPCYGKIQKRVAPIVDLL